MNMKRKAVYAFLYEQYLTNPNRYFSREELEQFIEKGQFESIMLFGIQLGHFEKYRGSYYRLTALGVLFTENNGYVTE